MDDDRGFVVYSHGHNGDFTFTEVETVTETLAEAKAKAERVMRTTRYEHIHNGKPTVHWVEVFGPGIEESLGLEERDGRLEWGP